MKFVNVLEPKTTWEYSRETEAKRLLHTAHQIAVGFYRVNNFIVLPYGKDYKDKSIVTFPDLSYYKIPRFWEKVKRIDVKTLPIKASPLLVKQVENLLRSENLPRPNYLHTKNLWEKASANVISEIYKIMPDKKNMIKKLTIIPTITGASCSFNVPGTFPTEILIWLKEDQNIYSITEAILTALTRHEVYTRLEGLWQESELLVDWLVSYSSIGKILEKYQNKKNHFPTIKFMRVKQRAELAKKSEEFYKKLGVTSFEHIFKIHANKPTAHGLPIENLTNREKEILNLMIKKESQITAIDELAQILFGNNDDAFSLQAIAKQIQRLRDKLEANGVPGSFIQTRRREGYVLIN